MKNISRYFVLIIIILNTSCSSPVGGIPEPVVHAVGELKDINNAFVPIYWKQGVLNVLPGLFPSRSCFAESLCLSGEDVYIGGVCSTLDYIPVPGYWKNNTWFSLPVLDSLRGGRVTSLAVYGSDIYI